MMVRIKLFIFGIILVTVSIGEIEHNCSSFGELCDPFHLQPCCRKGLSCKRRQSQELFQEKCICDDNFNWINNSCQNRVFCTNDENCNRRKYAECSEDNICKCKANYVAVSLSVCQPLIGAFCEKTEECFPENSVCMGQICQCSDNFVLINNNRCVPTYFIIKCDPKDEVCQEAQFFSCNEDGICFCQPNYVIINNKPCLPLLNETCSENKFCVVDNSECVDSKCRCKNDYMPQSYNRCMLAHLYGKCKNDEDCSYIKNSKCSNFGDCVCRNNYFNFNNRTCYPGIGEACTSNLECFIDDSICINKTCQCMPSVKFVSNKKCARLLRKDCFLDSDCYDIKFTYCSRNNTCICEPNYVASADETSCLSILGRTCEFDENCVTENSRCYFKKCQCKNFHHLQEIDGRFECIRINLLGSPCQNNEDCSMMKNTRCSEDKICVCRQNYYAFDNQTVCAPVIGGDCSRDKDCRIENSYCYAETCQCKASYLAISDTRCGMEHLIIKCDSDFDCGDRWHVSCSSNKICRCKSSNTLYNQATCYPLLKGLCWLDSQCMVLNSSCVDYHCECNHGFKMVATNLCYPVTLLV